MNDIDELKLQHQADREAIHRIAQIDAMPARARACCILEREELVNRLNAHGYKIPHRGASRASNKNRKPPKPRRVVKPGNCKVSQNMRHRLIQIHLHMGREESSRMCAEAGLNPRYAYSLCQSLFATKGPGRPSKPLKQHVTRPSFKNKKWERAIAVGMVVA